MQVVWVEQGAVNQCYMINQLFSLDLTLIMECMKAEIKEKTHYIFIARNEFRAKIVD